MTALIYKSGTERERRFPLKLGVNSVGRVRGNDVRLNRVDVSRHHAEIRVTAEGVLLKDLDSSNHCFVNGVKVAEAELHDGDEVRFSSVRLSFVAGLATANVDTGVEQGSSRAEAEALAAEIAAQASLQAGVHPARGAEVAAMVANLPSSAKGSEPPSLLRLPEAAPKEMHLAQLHVLLDIANCLSSPKPVREQMIRALGLVLQYLDVDRAAVLAVSDGAGDKPVVRALATRLRNPRVGDGATDFYNAEMVATAIMKGGPGMSVDDAPAHAGDDVEVHVALCVPLGRAAADAGLYVESLRAKRVFSDEDLEFIIELAAQIGTALANARVFAANLARTSADSEDPSEADLRSAEAVSAPPPPDSG